MILDGKRLSEAERLKLAADEEHAALEAMVQEYTSNALISSRLSIHTPTPAQEVSAHAAKSAAKVDTHSDTARSVEPGACEALLGIRLLIKQAF